ncbi:MAG: hypothetical protein FD147_916 [Chloroflexi bacterium]|nr:MAG: hypothetical protein FD147_916 [Chloroflexota bacterium]
MVNSSESVNWHNRFAVQSTWTKPLRNFLYKQIGINQNSRILEVGCGTGVITSELHQFTFMPATGIDLQHDRLRIAARQDEFQLYVCADAYSLPFTKNLFDFVLTHFFFLWVQDPISTLVEMLRVLKPGGWVIALAEPDYLARIDSPAEFDKLGQMQTQALIAQGANPASGRSLPQIFSNAGVEDIQYGISGFQVSPVHIPDWYESEWNMLREDLAHLLSENELDRLQELDLKARKSGCRVLWIPTFYAYGKKS